MAAKLKVENGKVQYLYKNFDDTYVLGEMPEGIINEDNLTEDSEIKGFGLTDGKFLFATTETRSKRPSIEDTSEI